MPDFDPGDAINALMGRQVAAQRMQQAVKPPFGRQEGAGTAVATQFIPQLFNRSIVQPVVKGAQLMHGAATGGLDPMAPENILHALQAASTMTGSRMPFAKMGELGAGGGKMVQPPLGYLDKIPMDQRLSTKGVSHPGYRWDVIDRHTGSKMGDSSMSGPMASRRVDKFDNKYGGYRYQRQMREAQPHEITPEEQDMITKYNLDLPHLK